MKVICLALLAPFAAEAFTVVGNSRPLSLSTTTVLRHHMGDLEHDALPEETVAVVDAFDDVIVYDNVAVALDDDARGVATTFVLAICVAVQLLLGQELFQARPAFATDFDFDRLPTTVLSAAAASVSDSDIVDFSMPSYQDASRAAINSNLKGEKFLLGEASKSFTDSSG